LVSLDLDDAAQITPTKTNQLNEQPKLRVEECKWFVDCPLMEDSIKSGIELSVQTRKLEQRLQKDAMASTRNKMNLAYSVGSDSEALTICKQLTEGKESRGLFRSGMNDVISRCLISLARYSESIPLLLETLERRHVDIDVWLLLGFVHAKLKQKKECLTALCRAVEVCPSYPQAWVELGTAFLIFHGNKKKGKRQKQCSYNCSVEPMFPSLDLRLSWLCFQQAVQLIRFECQKKLLDAYFLSQECYYDLLLKITTLSRRLSDYENKQGTNSSLSPLCPLHNQDTARDFSQFGEYHTFVQKWLTGGVDKLMGHMQFIRADKIESESAQDQADNTFDARLL